MSRLFSRRTACCLVFSILILVITLGGVNCLVSSKGQTEGAETLNVGMERTVINALIFVAANQNYFTANGLDVKIRFYPSELAAVNGMVGQQVNLALASEFVFVGSVFAGEKIRVLASIDEFLYNYLIARKDRGIAVHKDLVGKKIGVTVKTAAEYYLGRFLELNGLDLGQVVLVNVSPQNFEAALASGEVDAVQVWQPYAKAIEDRMGSGIILWPAQSEQVGYETILCSDDWAKQNPRLVKRFLTALAQAEKYMDDHPSEAREIVQNALGLDTAYMDEIWPQQQYQLALDQSMILAMEDEARWMIQYHLPPSTQTPVFLNDIDVESLQSVSPDAVNIIR